MLPALDPLDLPYGRVAIADAPTLHGLAITDELGGGCTSRVLRAHAPDGTPYALKIALPGFEPRLDIATRLATRIHHPRIVIGTPLHAPDCLRMPWIDGAPIDQLEPQDVPSLVGQLVDLIEHLHDHGVIHRDIKPANILVSDGQVWLLDLDSAVIDPGRQVPPEGSPAYMPVEAILRWRVGPTTDWFALGITLYELLTGSLPFDQPSLQDELLLKESGTWAPVRGTPADAWWNELFTALFDIHPDARWTGPRIRGHLLRYQPVSVAAPRHAHASACRSATA